MSVFRDEKENPNETDRLFSGPGTYNMALESEATGDLAELVLQLLEFSVPCGGALCKQPATRQVQGQTHTAKNRQSAVVVLCDSCKPPTGGIFGRYDWFQPFDLPYAGVLRAITKLLTKGNL